MYIYIYVCVCASVCVGTDMCRYKDRYMLRDCSTDIANVFVYHVNFVHIDQ